MLHDEFRFSRFKEAKSRLDSGRLMTILASRGYFCFDTFPCGTPSVFSPPDLRFSPVRFLNHRSGRLFEA